MHISFAFHLIGIVLWLGGLILLPRVMKAIAELPQEAAAKAMLGVRRVFWGFVMSGFVISLVSGLGQVIGGGVGYYLKAGWFHGKLTFVILLLVATAFLTMEILKSARGEALNPRKLMMVHGIGALSLVVIVFLTFLGR